MILEDREFIETAMSKLSYEFSNCIIISRDYNIRLTKHEMSPRQAKIVVIQDYDHNVQHIGIVTDSVGDEFTEYPYTIKKELTETIETVIIYSGNSSIDDNGNESKNLVFSKSVYVYANEFSVSKERMKKHFNDSGLLLFFRDKNYWRQYMESKKPDLFICHDSRDKEVFARPLAEELSKRLLKVWYDKYSLSIGDSLIDKIDEGLRECEFAIIVISQNFLARKKWTNREFRSLATKEINSGKKVILPIWLNVSQSEVANYSLDLVDKFALRADQGIEKIADIIHKEVKKLKK